MKVDFNYIDFAEKIIEYKKQLRKKKKKVVSKGGVSIGEMGSNNTIYINPWEQAKIEVDRISKEFMKELADAINKEVERQMKAKEKESLRNMTTREILEMTYKEKGW